MSYKIKPEDIPNEMMGDGRSEFCDFLAAILNHAIEAGLVSPPCHVKRHLGELECQGGTINPQLFIGKPKEEGDEHWKGQTK